MLLEGMWCVCLRFKLASQKALSFCMCLLMLDGVLDVVVGYLVCVLQNNNANTRSSIKRLMRF